MSHSTVMVVIREAENALDAESKLEGLLAPFDENTEVEPYPEWQDSDSVDRAIEFYRRHPEHCPGSDEDSSDHGGPVKPFDDFVTSGNLDALTEWTRQAVGAYCSSDRNEGVYDVEKNRYGYTSTYNPRSRWDWWSLGGRWRGFFQLKPSVVAALAEEPHERVFARDTHDAAKGMPVADESTPALMGAYGGVFGEAPGTRLDGKADLARKCDVDWSGMRDLAGHQAEARYDEFLAATEGLTPAPPWKTVMNRHVTAAGLKPDAEFVSLSEVERENYRAAVDAARREYNDHPWTHALREAQLDPFFEETREYYCVDSGGKDAFIQRARHGACSTFAVLLDGEWYEKGRMGWWGMVADERDEVGWLYQQANLIDRLPNTAWLAVVDVHI